MPSITIIGPGALGLLFAVKLARCGHGISILDYREKRAERLNRSGLKLEEEEEKLTERPLVTISPEELYPKPGYVMVLVKAYQTESILGPLEKIISEKTLVVSLQNGIGAGEILEKAVPAQNICLGTTTHGANLKSENTVRHAGTGPTVIGPFVPGTSVPENILSFAGILQEAGFETQTTGDIYPYLWRKLLVNIGINPLTALTGLKNGQLLEDASIRRIQEMAVSEAFEIIRLGGIDPGMDMDSCLEMVRNVCRKTAENRSSMLQDRINRRETEIEFITGAVLKKAREMGMQAPVNEVLTNLITHASRTNWEQFNT